MDLTYIDLTHTPLNQADDWVALRMLGAFENGLVSVILPTYNRAIFLAEAIDSVLNQTYRPIELLIIDDGSTDNTFDIVREKIANIPSEVGFKICYMRQPNRGASAARNQGLIYSQGEFIQYLDSDDVLVRQKIARHVAALAADESLEVVWSEWLVLPSGKVKDQLQVVNDTQTIDYAGCRLMVTDESIPWEPWATLTRRRFVAAHPLWNEHVSRWDDWEYALRLLAAKPKRAMVLGIGYIQREHDMGRRYDFDFNPAGVEVGLTACRQAKNTRLVCSDHDTYLDQMVANRFWEVGLEALIRGSVAQTAEGFGSAASNATNLFFKAKAAGSWVLIKLVGRRITRRLLSRYYI